MPLIPEALDGEIELYCSRVVGRLDSSLLAFGAYTNHVHLILAIHPTKAIAEVVGKVKANSSRWLKSKVPAGDAFGWQQTYAAITFSPRDLPAHVRYVKGQRQHHKRKTLDAEMKAFVALG